jgi:hypothetical protein
MKVDLTQSTFVNIMDVLAGNLRTAIEEHDWDGVEAQSAVIFDLARTQTVPRDIDFDKCPCGCDMRGDHPSYARLHGDNPPHDDPDTAQGSDW